MQKPRTTADNFTKTSRKPFYNLEWCTRLISLWRSFWRNPMRGLLRPGHHKHLHQNYPNHNHPVQNHLQKISITDISTIPLTTLITINFPVLRPWKKTLTQTTFGWERRETEGDQGGLRSDDSIITLKKWKKWSMEDKEGRHRYTSDMNVENWNLNCMAWLL